MRPAALMRGADLERHLARVGRRASTGESGDVQQRAQAGIAHLRQPAQTVRHDDAILAGERHHVGHRGDGRQLQERFGNAPHLVRRPAEVRQQRLDQLERHAGAAQVLLRIGAVRAVGIEHRQRGRQFRFGQVMVGDDHVDAQFVGAAHHFGGADAGIHADDQLDALCGRGLHHFRAHAVAVLQTVRHVIAGDAAGELDGLREQHHGGGAVHVVVAVDQDLLAVRGWRARCVRWPPACRAWRADRAVLRRRDGESAARLRGRRGRGAPALWPPPVPICSAADTAATAMADRAPAAASVTRRASSWRNTRQASRLRPYRPPPGRLRSRLPRPGIPRTSRAGVRRRRGWNRD